MGRNAALDCTLGVGQVGTSDRDQNESREEMNLTEPKPGQVL